jgi:hypothetical protein
VKLPAAGIALQRRDACLTVRHHDVHRHARRYRPQRGDRHPAADAHLAGGDKAVTTIVRRRTELAPQVGGIDRAVEKRNLIVVGVVERLGSV